MTPSALKVAPWIVKARGFGSSLAHDIAQERARRWIDSAPFAPNNWTAPPVSPQRG